MLEPEAEIVNIYKNMTDAKQAKIIYQKAFAPYKFFIASMRNGMVALQAKKR